MSKKKAKKRPAFQHNIIELFGTDQDLLINNKSIENHIEKFIEKLKLEVVNYTSHNFRPQGATLIYILSSSHLIVHTWPEDNYLHIDLLVCSKPISSTILARTIELVFRAKSFKIKTISY